MTPLLLGSLLNPLDSTMIATALVAIGQHLHSARLRRIPADGRWPPARQAVDGQRVGLHSRVDQSASRPTRLSSAASSGKCPAGQDVASHEHRMGLAAAALAAQPQQGRDGGDDGLPGDLVRLRG